MDVEIRHLRSFVAVAEERNFTRAAERLHLAQPALSVQIRQLEERMGARLVERTTRRVALTPAGEALLERARALLDGVASAVQQVQDTAAGRTGRLRVGLGATASLDLAPVALRAFAAAVPNADISVHDVRFDDPSGGVRDRTTDVAIVWTPLDETGLELEPLSEEPRRVVLARDHRLADARRIAVDDLLGEPFPISDSPDPVAERFWTLTDERGGPPDPGIRITGQEDLLVGVRSGRLIAAMPQALIRHLPFDDIVAREVEGLRPAGLAICRPVGDTNPLADAFAAAVRGAVGR